MFVLNWSRMVSVEEETTEKCLEAQIEEIEVLCSIYGNEWKTENEAERSYSIEIKQENLSLTLYITLPTTYPFESPPTYTLLAPGISKEHKNHLINQLEQVYLQNIGQTVLFQWIDKIKEFLSSLILNSEGTVQEKDIVKPIFASIGNKISNNVPEILHGETIVDRKSVFQGHVAIVLSVEQVKQALNKLKSNRKVANATHNIYAYIISHSTDSFIQDYDDDGETNAGGRLLHLLQVLNASNILVVVSRWYGGIHLGADRFRHINRAARQVLEQAGLLNNKKKT